MRWLIGVACLALVACGKQAARDEGAAQPATEAPTAATAGEAPAKGGTGAAPVTVSVPQMAYSYSFKFRLPGELIAQAEQAAVALCDSVGAARCQLLAMTDQAAAGEGTEGTLKLRVASGIARRFAARLQRQVSGANGRTLQANVTAEDVSKDISDTEARLHQREILVQRLTQVLATRQGSVADLVEAERSVAAAQEELDQARSWLAELRGRVAMSTIEVSYESVAADAGDAGGGLSEALARSWSGFVHGMAALLEMAIIVLPWALVGGVVIWLVRRLRRRFPPRAPAAPYRPPPVAPVPGPLPPQPPPR